MRWLERFGLEGRGVTIADLQDAVEVLSFLRQTPTEGMEQLLELCVAHG